LTIISLNPTASFRTGAINIKLTTDTKFFLSYPSIGQAILKPIYWKILADLTTNLDPEPTIVGMITPVDKAGSIGLGIKYYG
jgi:hypothetical protein